ncbi:MAG: SIMPL domain-containing protein [Rikenellaceae bacterium]
MRRVFLTLLTMVLATGAMAQEIQNYINVNGRSEIKITPNKFTLNIVIDEAATRGVRSVDEAERRMRTALKKIGINVEERLTVSKMTATDLKREGNNSSATYQLEVNDGEMVRKSFQALQNEGITAVTLQSADHSDIEKYKKEAIRAAIADGREQAEMIAETLGQPLGDVYKVNNAYSSANSNINNIQARGVAYAAPEPMPELDFQQITINGSVSLYFVLGVNEQSKTMIIK